MRGFQPMRVEAIRSERIACIIKVRELRVKAFQVIFRNDGSLFINFPYFRHRTGLLSSSAMPSNGQRQIDVNLEQGGKVTSHLVKYSHHPDGRAHFSQDGKIVTAVKRQSVPLDRQEGHIFSLLIQGLNALEPADPVKDAITSTKRASIEFSLEPPEAVKIIGRWCHVDKLMCSEPNSVVGPVVPTIDPDGKYGEAILVASPYANVRHVLAISCVPFHKLSSEPEIFLFYGGFDSPEVMTNAAKEAGFLAFLYPISESEKTKQRLGSVDYVPRS
jgi:hypothetical protein